MRELTLRECEGRLEVLGEVLRLFDAGNDGGVDVLLGGRLVLWERLLLLRLALGEELLLCGLGAL